MDDAEDHARQLADTQTAARMIASNLHDYAAMGALAEFTTADDPCAICTTFRGRVFDPRTAPPIPVPDCQNDYCRCDYSPSI